MVVALEMHIALQPLSKAGSISPTMEEDVEQLLLKRQYSQAFRRLLNRYSNKVFRMACVMLKDRGRAEEVTQDIFVKIWQALPDFDGRAAVSTWLYAIARNACLSALRSESYRKTVPLDEAKAVAIKNTSAVDISVHQCLSRLP